MTNNKLTARSNDADFLSVAAILGGLSVAAGAFASAILGGLSVAAGAFASHAFVSWHFS